MRTYELLAVVAASTLLSACKNESADVNLTIDAAAPPPPVVVDAAAPVPTPIPPPPPVVTPPTTPKSTTTSDAGAGTSLDAGASDAAAPTDAGVSGKLAACFQKCQGILASCATPTFPADGGLPQIKDPKACEAAFETCRVACAP